MDLNTALARRISEARNRLGFTQAELAVAAGLPAPQTVSDIELGKRTIRAAELATIAKALHLSLADLLSDQTIERPLVLWRVRPEHAEAVEAEFVRKCEEYKYIESLVGYTCKRKFPQEECDPEFLGYSQVTELASIIASILNLGSYPAASLRTILEEDYGVKIWYHRANNTGSAASTYGDFGPAILMNAEEAPWRRNFSFAHELFHLVTWRSIPPEKLIQNNTLWEQVERLANYFASALLLPADIIGAEFDKRLENHKIKMFDLIALARQFEVSTEALLWRLVSLRRLQKTAVDKLLRDPVVRMQDRSTTEGLWDLPPTRPERFVRMAFLAYKKGDLSRAKLAQLLGESLVDLSDVLRTYGLDESQVDDTELTASA